MNKINDHIGLFFGSFNPIHNGHLGLARFFIQEKYFDKVWFVISPQSPFKQDRLQLSERERFTMATLATEDYHDIEPCDIEFNLHTPSYTIDTLRALELKYPDKKFSIILGSDQSKDFKKWKEWEAILKDYHVYFYPRNGYENQELPNTTTVQAPIFEISSSEIREKIERNENISNFVPEKVEEYIRRNNLYSGKKIRKVGNLMKIITFLICITASLSAFSQFYNGSQMTFGKKKVQYGNFMWSYYQHDDYDIYFYQNGQNLAIEANEVIKNNLEGIEKAFNIRLGNKLRVIIYNTLSDFNQTNLGTLSQTSYNTGGISYIIDNKIFLYFNGDINDFKEQVKASLYKIIMAETMKGSTLASFIENAEVSNDWFIDGLASFYSREWDSEMDNEFRNILESGKIKKLKTVDNEYMAIVGHSVWKYIADLHGRDVPLMIFNAAIREKKHYNSFNSVLGLTFEDLEKNWKEYYTALYSQYPQDQLVNDADVAKLIYTKSRNPLTINNIRLSVDGRQLAYTINEKGLKKMYILDLVTGKKKKVYKTGYRSYNKSDITFPVVAWHPNGRTLAVATEEQGKSKIFFYDLYSGNIFFPSNISLSALSFQKVLDMSYSPDGRSIILSGVKNGQSDIYLWNITSGVAKQLTNDEYNDFNPRFLNNKGDIVFSSNRQDSDENISGACNIFKININNSDEILQLTYSEFSNNIEIRNCDNGNISFLSDDNGIYNLYIAKFDSTISFVDTITHYNYFIKTKNVTNDGFSILDYDIAGSKVISLSKIDNRNYVTERIIPQMTEKSIAFTDDKLAMTPNKHAILLKDSLSKINTEQESKKTLNFFDVQEYDFRADIPTRDVILGLEPDSTKARIVKIDYDNEEEEFDKWKYYKPEFFINSLITQIDFTSMSNSYQQFTGGAAPIYLYKGFNLLTGVGITDLMEDYHLTAAFSLSSDLINNEYAISYANLKERLDKEFIFHRFTDISYPDGYGYVTQKQRTHEFIYKLTYPFTEFMHVSGSAIVKNNQTFTTDILDISSVGEFVKKSNWLGVRGEFVYDNTIDLSQNIMLGTRFKLFGEYNQMIIKENRNLMVFGFDFRNYQRIFREMIFAWRVAGSSSLGSDRLIYYMGGVDNWILPSFNSANDVSPDINYAYQTLATNMRGFAQNTRNGPNFAVINAEIRFPFIRFFANRPISSKFFNSLQLVGFYDFGTAWNGISPYSKENSLFVNRYENNPLYIVVNEHRDPFVMGYGVGLRASLLGYFIRVDYGWGVEDGVVNDGCWHISLCLDF